MELIQISNDPITGLERKLDYEFFWHKSQIIIKCFVSFYKDEERVESVRTPSYVRNLVATHDTPVNSQTGEILASFEEFENATYDEEGNRLTGEPIPTMSEYDYYAQVIGNSLIVLPELIKNVVLLRDSQGKFDI